MISRKKLFFRGFLAGVIAFVILIICFISKYWCGGEFDLKKLQVQTLNGKLVDFTTPRSKPLVINFWGTWCGPCVAELPAMDSVSNRWKDSADFFFISDEEKEILVKFQQSHPYQINYAVSNLGLEKYGITARPTTYFIYPNGKIMKSVRGSREYNELDSLVSQLVK